MIRTGEQYRSSLRDGRDIWINGEKVKDVTLHPATAGVAREIARLYDLQHAAGKVAVRVLLELAPLVGMHDRSIGEICNQINDFPVLV